MATRVLFAVLVVYGLETLPLFYSQVPRQPQAPLPQGYEKIPDLVYKRLGNRQLRLDLYSPRDLHRKIATLVYFHGGGWHSEDGDKDNGYWSECIIPWMERGFNVAMVDYRGSQEAKAPAAVEDCRCAVRWVLANARKYQVDTTKIVLSGDSAGAHLALIAGMAPASLGFEKDCLGPGRIKVAAIVNFYGITDVADLLDGPHQRDFALSFVPEGPHRMEIAKQVSPLTHVRVGLPPIMTIHGDADPIVPYSQAQRFHEALKEAKVPEFLYTIPKGVHDHFTVEQKEGIRKAINWFLKQHRLM